MQASKNTDRSWSVVYGIGRFLVVWLASALVVWVVMEVLAWSGVVLTEGIELTLLVQPALVAFLMAWWRWSPADAPEDVAMAIAKGDGAAVLTVWVTVGAILGYLALYPSPDLPPDFWSFWSVFGPPLLFSVLALLTGLLGASIGAALAKWLRGR
jgi:hypothetical protein